MNGFDKYKGNYTKHYETLVGALAESPEILIWEIINEPMTSQFEIILDFASNVSEKIKQIDPLHAVSIGTIGGIGDRFGSELSRFSCSNFKGCTQLKHWMQFQCMITASVLHCLKERICISD